ncbi:MAG TPA: hypothetical protein VGM28_01595 [Candidatus Limnocylindrales bacterium]|jgi:hypothetical protein
MALVEIVLLLVFFGFAVASAVMWREYQRAYAEVHHDIPPLASWVVRRDRDADVESTRRTSIFASLAALVVLGVLAAVLYNFPVV